MEKWDYEKEPYESYMKRKGLHYCDSGISPLEDSAVSTCSEDEEGLLLVNGSEYGSYVNYCPICGYKAKRTI